MSNPATPARIELLTCPFCGGTEPELMKERHGIVDLGFRYQCTHCGSTSSWRRTKEGAVEQWNIRPRATSAVMNAPAAPSEAAPQEPEARRDGVVEPRECPNCFGSGLYDEQRCSYCGGSGANPTRNNTQAQFMGMGDMVRELIERLEPFTSEEVEVRDHHRKVGTKQTGRAFHAQETIRRARKFLRELPALAATPPATGDEARLRETNGYAIARLEDDEPELALSALKKIRGDAALSRKVGV